MILSLSAIVCLLSSANVAAQTSDPVIMTVAGQDVTRSEFEYSYNKNNSEGVIDKKTVDEYADLFINYKLKVRAALDERFDTLTSFRQEFTMYRDQQIRPTMVTDDDVVVEARKMYERTKANIGERGLIHPAHIFLRLSQNADKATQDAAHQRIDSIYRAIQDGAKFEELAAQLSQDQGTAREGGLLPWIQPNQTLKEFEDEAYALQPGQMSKPFLSPAGYHIVLMKERKQIEPFDSLKANIIRMLEMRGIREHIADEKIDSLVNSSNGSLTRGQVMDAATDRVTAADPEMKNLVREYYEGLLLYEISNREVWDKAAKDEAGLDAFFKAHRKKYNWSEPHYKGMAYHVKTKADVKAVRNSVKKVPFEKWADVLRTTFNGDSVIRIRVEKGIFKKGDHALIDRMVFKKDTTVVPVADYPIDAVYGKKLKKGPEDYTDVRGEVTADYQDLLEKRWVAELRRKYAFTVNNDVLKTVNNHQ